jgi:3-hydroxyisobutyrate dehydrogenase
MDTIGVIGLGIMGLASSRKIIEAGYPLIAYDISETAKKKAGEMGAAVAGSPAELTETAEIVLMFLPGPIEVELCVAGPEGLLSGNHTGIVIVDMSTVDPKSTQRMAALALEHKAGYLDAPVLGRPIAVGKWALPIGGSEEDMNRCRTVLECVASTIVYVGPSGTGNKIKLLNQLMFGSINAITAEMMAISKKVGISPELLYNTITASQAGTVSNLFKELGKHIVAEDYDDPAFTVDLLNKDIRLAVEMAKEYDAPPLLSRTVEYINEIAQTQGYGSKDTSVMWKCFDSIWYRSDSSIE